MLRRVYNFKKGNTMKKILFLIGMALVLGGCISTDVDIVAGKDLNQYAYISLDDVQGYEVKFYEALQKTRLKVIGIKQIDSLVEDEKSKVLLARLTTSVQSSGGVVMGGRDGEILVKLL